MILISVVLLTVVHPGIFASAIHESGMDVYEPKAHSRDCDYGYEMCGDTQHSCEYQREHGGGQTLGFSLAH
jgi:elongation factor P hydroxylase